MHTWQKEHSNASNLIRMLRMQNALVIGFVTMLAGCPASLPVSPQGDDEAEPVPRRGTSFEGLDVVGYRVEIYREGDLAETVAYADGDEDGGEVILQYGDRALVFMTVVNESDGWWPFNFELCVENREESLAVLHPDYDYDSTEAVLPDEYCIAYWPDDVPWPQISRNETEEHRAGGIAALDDPGADYFSVFFRLRMPDEQLVDLVEYTIPFRVVPPSDGPGRMAMLANLPRRPIKRRLL